MPSMSSPWTCEALRQEALTLTGGAFVRLSRDPAALFASDFPARGCCSGTPEALYTLHIHNGLAFLTPNEALFRRMEGECRPIRVLSDGSETGLWFRHFSRLLESLPHQASGDSAFLLSLLRADGEAGLRKDPALIRMDLDRALALLQCRGPKGSRLTLALFQSLGSHWFPCTNEEVPQ